MILLPLSKPYARVRRFGRCNWGLFYTEHQFLVTVK